MSFQSGLTAEHPSSLIQARLQVLEEELSRLKRAEELIRRGDTAQAQLQYSYWSPGARILGFNIVWLEVLLDYKFMVYVN